MRARAPPAPEPEAKPKAVASFSSDSYPRDCFLVYCPCQCKSGQLKKKYDCRSNAEDYLVQHLMDSDKPGHSLSQKEAEDLVEASLEFNNSFKSDSSSGKAPTTASSPTPAPAASSASARWVMNGAPINPPPPAVCRGSLPAINPPPPAVRRLLSSPHVCTKGFRYVENPVWLSLFP